MYQHILLSSELERLPLDVPGVSLQILQKEASGGMTVLTHLEAGASIPKHWHSLADETVYVLAGDFVEAGTSYGPGIFFIGKAGTPHGPHSSVNGSTVLTRFSAELDFQSAD